MWKRKIVFEMWRKKKLNGNNQSFDALLIHIISHFLCNIFFLFNVIFHCNSSSLYISELHWELLNFLFHFQWEQNEKKNINELKNLSIYIYIFRLNQIANYFKVFFSICLLSSFIFFVFIFIIDFVFLDVSILYFTTNCNKY